MTSFYGSVNGGQGGGGEGIDTSTLMQKNNPTFNGTITGPNARFTGTVQIPEPTEDNHAATKGYVDAALADVDLSEVTTRMDAIETAQDELAAQLDDKVDAESPAFTGTATLNGKNIATVDQIPNISDLPYLDENNPTYTGTLAGADATFSGVVSVPTPTQDGQAVNKQYVDQAIAGVQPEVDLSEVQANIAELQTGKLDKANPTYTGNLAGENAAFSGTVTVATPAAEGEAANKGYVDAAKTELEGDINTLQQTVANQTETINTLNQQVTNITGGTAELPYLKNTGDSGTGVYNFTGATVNTADPVDNSNVATKHYVDQKVASAGGTGEVVSYTQGDGISISLENEISLSIDSAGANGLKVGANGLGLDLATATTSGAMAASDKTAIASNTTEITNIKNGTTKLPYLKETNPTYEGTLIGGDATFTGSVQVSTPDQDNEAANKSYVDATVAASNETIQQIQTDVDSIEDGTTELPYVKDSGDTVTGTYNFTGANVTIAEPTVSNNPATKNYVDTKIASAGGSGEVVSYTQGNGINISPENVISVVIAADNANGLAVDTSGLKLNVATPTTAGAMSGADKAKLDATSTTEQMNQAISSAIDETLEDPTKLPFVNINGDTMHGSLTTTELFTDFVTIRNAGTDGNTGFQNNSDTDHIRVYDKVANTFVPIEVGEPVNNQDASTKKYVDDKVTTETAARTEAIESLDEAKANKDNPTFTGIISGANATLSGTLTGNTATFSGGITVPLEPGAEGSATSKKYVDDQIAAIDIEPLTQRVATAEGEIDTLQSDIINITNGTTELPYIPSDGGTISGPINWGGNPQEATELANKAYVDANDSDAVNSAKEYTNAQIEIAKGYTDEAVTNLTNGTIKLPYITKEEVEIAADTRDVARAYRYTFNDSLDGTNSNAGFGFIDYTPAIVTEKDGSTSFSPLYIGEPEKDSQATTKKYVDDKAGDYLPLVGGTMTGSINAGENTVTNLKEPEGGTDATTKNYVDGKIAQAAPVSPEISGKNLIQIKDSVAYRPLQGLKIFGKSTQVKINGYQLFDASTVQYGYRWGSSGLENVEGSTEQYWASAPIPVVAGSSYTVTRQNSYRNFYLDESESVLEGIGAYENSTYPFTFTVPETANFVVFTGKMNPEEEDATPVDPQNVMLNLGPAALPYEPYTGGKPSPSVEDPSQIQNAGAAGSIPLSITDGADRNQSLTVSTPNGLPGIPVDSGGNYIDAERQQWVCDVKDYGTGKYTQMVGHIESYNSENITTPYMSTTGQLSTGAEVYYVLDEPVVTDISTEELAAYRALYTYDGTTIISTDEDISGLKVKYVAKAIDYQQSINAAIQKINDKIDAVYNSLVKKAESVDEVNQLFKDWWNANWEEGSSTYNDMLERWFGKVLDDDKVYGVKLPLFETSTSPQGEYIEDCVGAIVIPSTEDSPGQNDFAKTPQFWCVEVAAEKNADGSHTIYACEFIDDIDVVRNGGPDNGKHLVWVLQKNTYVHEYEESGYSYIKIQCHPADGFIQWPQGTDRTGHTYSYIANPKYAAGIDDEGNIGCRTGLKPTCYMSMNETIQAWRARGPQYSGSSACFYKWAYIMYALLTAKKGENVGCNNYDYQYAAAVSESGVSRIILTADQAYNLYVGSNVIIGNTEGDNDRDEAAMCSLVKLRKISSIEEVNIEEDASSYKAIYIDVPDETTFDTTVGTTYISTMPFYSGWTDTVKGTLGTKYGTNFDEQPFLLQKVELMNGAHNYASDELDQWSQQDDTHYLYDFYLCEDQTKVSTNGTITDDYTKKENATLTIDTTVYTTNNSWYYIEDNLTDNNFKMLTPKKFSPSAGSGTGTRDAFYLQYAASKVRTPIVWGNLFGGGFSGLSCRHSNGNPSRTRWHYAGGSPGLSG